MDLLSSILQLIERNPFISITLCLLIALGLITYEIVRKKSFK